MTVTARGPLLVCLAAFALIGTGCDGALDVHAGGSDYQPGAPGNNGNNGNNGTVTPETPAPEASLHRLNRLEYNNSVRDLLGTTLRPADDFPPDASVGGFDNGASALGITPTLMDRYVEAARNVVEDAFAARPAFQNVFEEDDGRLTYSIDRDANRIGGIVRLRGGSVQTEIDVPRAGAHTVVVRAQGVHSGAVAAPVVRLTVAGQVFDFNVPLTMTDSPFALELAPGRHAVSLQALNFEEVASENRGNDILFDLLTVRSDELVEGPGRARILICDPANPQDPGCVSNVIHTFARRAWRRPLGDAERASLDALFTSLRTQGEEVEESIKLVLRAILTSPRFLYRYRLLDDGDTETLLDPYVLASRLSYFIWSTTPDERLLSEAASGTLSSADGVRQTVAWMLADERASALASGFAEQWLDLRHLEQASPSAEIYPTFNEPVRGAMIHESRLFFLDYLSNDASLATMLQPDFAYRDAVLAQHLQLEGPVGEGFERFAVAPGDRRGILALSAWLTARSASEHSSPIRRGAWVADNILCAPVPPPPAGLDIGELEEGGGELSVREQLERHRDDQTCAGCHQRLDVIGMGFEVYDGVGSYIDDPTLDSRGELAGAGDFRGAEEMASLIDRTSFVRCVSRKLFSYALGRTAEPEDLAVLDELDDSAVTSFTLPELVTAIAISPAFSQPRPLE